MASDLKLTLESNNLIKLVGLINTSTGQYVNDATVQITLLQCDKTTEVKSVSQSWPAALTYIVDSNGDYERTLADDLQADETTQYYGKVVATTLEGHKKTWLVPVRMIWDDGI